MTSQVPPGVSCRHGTEHGPWIDPKWDGNRKEKIKKKIGVILTNDHKLYIAKRGTYNDGDNASGFRTPDRLIEQNVCPRRVSPPETKVVPCCGGTFSISERVQSLKLDLDVMRTLTASQGLVV